MHAIKQCHCNCFGSLDNEMSANVGRMTGITYMATSRWGGSALLCPRQQSCPAVWGRACGSMKGPAQCLCSQPAALPSGSPQTRRSAHCLPLTPGPAQSATQEPVCSNVDAKHDWPDYLIAGDSYPLPQCICCNMPCKRTWLHQVSAAFPNPE